MLILYRIVWLILFIPSLILLFIRLYKGKEDPARWQERLGLGRRNRQNFVAPNGKLVWLHGASVGEAISLMPLIKSLQKQDDIHILLTTGTRTSAKIVEQHFAEMPDINRLMHQFFPFDFFACVRHFHTRWQPDTCVFTESEFWPEHLHAAKPLLLNARISDTSWPKYKKYQWFFGWVLSHLSGALAQREEDAERLKSLGVTHVQACGNLKYDAAPLAYHKTQFQKLSAALKGKKLLVFSSTHAGEEDMALRIHTQLKEHIPNLTTVIVPRHPERGTELAQIYKLPTRSQGATLTAKTDLYLADTLGELGLWYALAAKFGLAVMGGSLVPHGGHNPLEPLKLGCPTIVGPHMFNFKDMLPQLQRQNLVQVCADADAITRTCKLQFGSTTPLTKKCREIAAKMPLFFGATAHAKTLILERLETS